MTELVRIPWKPLEPLPASECVVNGAFAALEALRREWERHMGGLSEAEQVAIRRRSLRRLAIETGILERLYDVEWGLTLTLVAEGFTRDVVERAGARIDESVLATLAAQRDSLELVIDYVRDERPLTRGFIKELHHAITRTQLTYAARDTLGRVFERRLEHGEFKSDPNHVERSDGTLLEYCPPEHVGSEIDRLLELYDALERTEAHPIVKAAWLHHRFVQIHPFADGNGRVARALTLLVLQRHHYAPLVVDRFHRKDYLAALDAANAGSLKELVRLFTKLESAALTAELEREEPRAASGPAAEIAHTLAAQLAAVQRRRASAARKALQTRAVAVGGRIEEWFKRKGHELEQVFAAQGVANTQVRVRWAATPEPRATWYRRQAIASARRAGHYADFMLHAGWWQLLLHLDQVKLVYMASLHGAGRESAAMAVTLFAELAPWTPSRADDAIEEPTPAREMLDLPADAFRFVGGESVDELEARAPELEELLERGLAEALAQVFRGIY